MSCDEIGRALSELWTTYRVLPIYAMPKLNAHLCVCCFDSHADDRGSLERDIRVCHNKSISQAVLVMRRNQCTKQWCGCTRQTQLLSLVSTSRQYGIRSHLFTHLYLRRASLHVVVTSYGFRLRLENAGRTILRCWWKSSFAPSFRRRRERRCCLLGDHRRELNSMHTKQQREAMMLSII